MKGRFLHKGKNHDQYFAAAGFVTPECALAMARIHIPAFCSRSP
jgi:hypothetical protein